MSALVPALVVAAALNGTVDVSARTEVRGRNSNAGTATFDLETALHLRALGRVRRWELKLGYDPQLTWRGDVGASPDFLHGLVLGAGYKERLFSLALYQEGSVGRTTWTPIGADSTGGPSLGALPSNRIIDYASSRTGMLAKLTPTRRLSLSFSLEHAASGGADASSREALPFQNGPRGTLGAELALTRRDHVTSTIGASWTGFSSGPEDTLVRVTESWRHAFGRYTESTLAGGAAWSTARAGPSEPFRSLAHPIAEVGINHRILSLRLDMRAMGRISPVIDPVSGRVDERFDTWGGVSWDVTRRLTIFGQGGAAQSMSWDKPGALTLTYHGLTITYRASKIVQIDTGTRGYWWRTRGSDAPPPRWIVFAGVTFTAPSVRF